MIGRFGLTLLALMLGSNAYAGGAPDAGTSDAGTSDAGTPDGGDGCGAVTFQGECNGDVVVYCDPDTNMVEMIDCVAEIDPNAACIEISADYGVDCALAVGDGCVDEEGNIFFCQGANAGCFEDPTGAICTETIGPCVMSDVDTCRGEQWIFECAENQPYVVDCDAYGGRCDDRPGRCFDLPAGSFCGEGFECAAGLSCSDLGLCTGSQVPDAGVTPDSGTMAPRDAGVAVTPPVKTGDEDSGCGCTTNERRGKGAWAVLALLALVVRRRRTPR